MAYRDLHDFMETLERIGELRRVTVEVDPFLEIAAITDRVCKLPGGGAALLFERVKGSEFPVATNLFGSFYRMALALGIADLNEPGRRLAALLADMPGAGLPTKLEGLTRSGEFRRWLPLHVPHGACHEVLEPIPDLTLYPILQSWPGDGHPDPTGRFMTLPLVISRDPESGAANCGMYRVRVFDKTTVGIHFGKDSGGGGHYRKYLERGERMPVAIAVGGDPAVIYAASVPLPHPLEEMQFAGFLRGEPVELTPCRTVPLMVPANAEIVLEGYLEPGERQREGAFGNHTGFYVNAGEVPVARLTCITRRRDVVYPATVVGSPPMEDCYMAKATERLLLQFIREEIPEVADISMPLYGIFHGCAVVSIEKSRPGQAREVMEKLWEGGWLGAARLLLLVDADLPLHDIDRVAWRVLNSSDWRYDLFTAATQAGERDSALRRSPFGGRIGIDATRKLQSEGMADGWPEEISMERTVEMRVTQRWREYGLG
ncbi:MAG: UbiD family decarboxylase [Geobacteraceae bacterium]